MRPGAVMPDGVGPGVLRADGARLLSVLRPGSVRPGARLPGSVRPDAVMPDDPDARAETSLLWDCR